VELFQEGGALPGRWRSSREVELFQGGGALLISILA